MKILVELSDNYARALTILARTVGKPSRQQFIEDLLRGVVDQNPGLLADADEMIAKEKGGAYKVGVKVELPQPEKIPIKRYRFTRRNGEVVEGIGSLPMEALKEAVGRAYTFAEYNEEFERHDIIHEEV